jgi:O-antigen biosynthesis protein
METEERPASQQYDFVIDLDSDNTHANVIGLVGEGRRVLELGPASGYMSAVLRERGCTVVGVELDPEMAAQAEQFCERVIVGDLDTLDLEAELGQDRFDVIVCAAPRPVFSITADTPSQTPQGGHEAGT